MQIHGTIGFIWKCFWIGIWFIILIHNNLSNSYYLIDDLLHSKNILFRADVKGCNSPIYQNLYIYIYIYIFAFVHIYYNQCRGCGSALGALHFRNFQNWNCKNNNHFNVLRQNSSARKLFSDIFLKIKKIAVTWDTWRSLCFCLSIFFLLIGYVFIGLV